MTGSAYPRTIGAVNKFNREKMAIEDYDSVAHGSSERRVFRRGIQGVYRTVNLEKMSCECLVRTSISIFLVCIANQLYGSSFFANMHMH